MKSNSLYSRPFTSLIPFVEGISGKRINGLQGARIEFSSKNLGWDGIAVEKGVQHGWDATDFSVPGHYLAINLSNVSLSFERKTPHGFKREVMPPGTLWLNPAGETFTHHVKQVCTYGAVVLDQGKLVRLTEMTNRELYSCYSLRDHHLVHLMHTLLLEARNGGINGELFRDSVTAAMAIQLFNRVSDRQAQPPMPIKGGIPKNKLSQVMDFAEVNLSANIRLEDLSSLVDLSPFHFAREFKRTTGMTPHRYIISRRLERAREWLVQGKHSIGEIANEFGFADQSHLTRLFKRQFGLTPADYIRHSRRR